MPWSLAEGHRVGKASVYDGCDTFAENGGVCLVSMCALPSHIQQDNVKRISFLSTQALGQVSKQRNIVHLVNASYLEIVGTAKTGR